jgi:hypothetical protein
MGEHESRLSWCPSCMANGSAKSLRQFLHLLSPNIEQSMRNKLCPQNTNTSRYN